ncbi:substrate-binding periplasmic protein [Noviherbaspirillum aerium]|uniref:substrate-binding periplasmic protein n=1 Tax=Noviherbaspirillum aerium TaxID=2588497 RepID=UPI00124D7776|nr:ABC transporter substrate-binding protein [Noviherbaspirillum aerium]
MTRRHQHFPCTAAQAFRSGSMAAPPLPRPAGRLALRIALLPLCLAGVLGMPGLQARAFAAETLPVLQIGVGLIKPPYFLAPGTGGMEYEIAEKAFEAGGYRMAAQHLPPSRALALLRAGHLDGMLSVTEGIGGRHYFSESYLHYQNVAIALSSRNLRIRGVSDLRGWSVAAFQNASLLLGEEFKTVATGHPDYREYAQQLTQNKLLYTGRVDVVVGDRLVFRHLSRHLEAPIDVRQAVTLYPLFPPSPRMAVFKDAAMRDAFNAGLQVIRRNGVYGAILKKYQEPA